MKDWEAAGLPAPWARKPNDRGWDKGRVQCHGSIHRDNPATGRRKGDRCTNRAREGTTCCNLHQSSKSIKAKAAQRVAAEQLENLAEAHVARLKSSGELDIITNPIERLGLSVAKMEAFRDYMEERVRAFDDKVIGPGDVEYFKAVAPLYRQSLNDVTKALLEWSRLGLDAMRVELDRRQGEAVVAMMEGFIRQVLVLLQSMIDAVLALLGEDSEARRVLTGFSDSFSEQARRIAREEMLRLVPGRDAA